MHYCVFHELGIAGCLVVEANVFCGAIAGDELCQRIGFSSERNEVEKYELLTRWVDYTLHGLSVLPGDPVAAHPLQMMVTIVFSVCRKIWIFIQKKGQNGNSK